MDSKGPKGRSTVSLWGDQIQVNIAGPSYQAAESNHLTRLVLADSSGSPISYREERSHQEPPKSV